MSDGARRCAGFAKVAAKWGKAALFCGMVWIWTGLTAAEAGTVFSFNGVGYPVRRIDTRTRGMGGAGRAVADGSNFSSANPAAMGLFRRSGLNSLYLVQLRTLDNGQSDHSVSDAGIGGLQFRLVVRPGTVLGVGLEPVTDVDFNLAEAIDSGPEPYTLRTEGSGGIQAVSAGLGQALNSHVYLGVRLDMMLMGTIRETWTKEFENVQLLRSEDSLVRTHRGISAALGAIFAPDDRWSLGLVFQPAGTIEQTRRFRNIFGSFFGTERRTEADVELPMVLGGGIAYRTGYRWMAALDFERAFWEETGTGRHDTSELAAGVLVRTGTQDPLVRSRRWELMLGGYSRSLYFRSADGSRISEVGGSLGLALPLQNNRVGAIRYVIEFGKRGDAARHGVSERFIQQTFSFSGWIN